MQLAVSKALVNTFTISFLKFKPLQALNPQSEERYKLLQHEFDELKKENGNGSNEILEAMHTKIVIIKKCFEVNKILPLSFISTATIKIITLVGLKRNRERSVFI